MALCRVAQLTGYTSERVQLQWGSTKAQHSGDPKQSGRRIEEPLDAKAQTRISLLRERVIHDQMIPKKRPLNRLARYRVPQARVKQKGEMVSISDLILTEGGVCGQ